MHGLKQYITTPIDNSALVIFRIFFGALMFCEAVGAVALGWVEETFVEPAFTFNFIGFDFLQVFVGPQMYVVYALMALASLGVMLGYRYRISIISFTILWAITYFGQKSHYNNHYYLILLIGFLLWLVPANRYASFDVKQGRVEKSLVCGRWCVLIFVVQIAIVYFYASIAKIYPDWLQAKPLQIWFEHKTYQTPFWSDAFAKQVHQFFSQSWVHYTFAYAGILFDLLVIPFFLWNRYTRTFALFASLLFHLTNSAIFQIGVFPYFALAFVVFFYSPDFIRRLFFKSKPSVSQFGKQDLQVQPLTTTFSLFLVAYFCFQLYLPIRHHFIPGKVLWTEEGHRLSWRMMLRTKTARTTFYVEDKETKERERIRLLDHISRHQYGDLITKPDFIWQFAQYLDEYYQTEKQQDVAVYAQARVGVNGRTYTPLIDETVDLSAVSWKRFGHQRWLLPAPF